MEVLSQEEELILQRLIEELKQHPRLRRPLIEALEMVELLNVPQQLDELKTLVEQILLTQAEHGKRIAHLETLAGEQGTRLAQVEELAKDHSARLARLEALAEDHSVRLARLEALGEDHSARLARLEALAEDHSARLARLEALGEDHSVRLARVEQAAEEAREEAREAKQEAREAKQEAREAKQIALEVRERVDRIEQDLAHLKGRTEELHAAKRMPAVFGRYLRKLRIYDAQQFAPIAEEQFQLSDEDYTEVLYADWFAHGRVRSSGREVWLVIEVSWGVGTDDVERAHARAAILRQAGVDAYGVAMGRSATSEAIERARELGVLLALDGTLQNAETLA